MAFSTLYRRLVEVRCLHSFYLENGEADDFYTLNDDKKAEQIVKIQYDIRNDIIIEPTLSAKAWLEAHRAVWIPTMTGFVVAIEANTDSKPKANLPAAWRIGFLIKIKNADWLTFTNVRMRPNLLPKRFYWTNADDVLGKKMPSLSVPLPDMSNKNNHEMGEWAIDTGVAKQAVSHQNDWQVTVPYNDYVHEEDSRVLPKQFVFKIPVPNVNVCLAVLTQFDGDGNPVYVVQKTIESALIPLSMMQVDFRFDNDSKLVPDGQYQLVFFCQRPDLEDHILTYDNIVLRSELDAQGGRFFGLVELVHENGLPEGQNILDTEGGIIEGGRVFEIRFHNRATYWQYRESRKDSLISLKDGAILDNQLATRQAMALTRKSKLIEVTDHIKLPSPSRLTLKDKNDRYYTEVVF